MPFRFLHLSMYKARTTRKATAAMLPTTLPATVAGGVAGAVGGVASLPGDSPFPPAPEPALPGPTVGADPPVMTVTSSVIEIVGRVFVSILVDDNDVESVIANGRMEEELFVKSDWLKNAIYINVLATTDSYGSICMQLTTRGIECPAYGWEAWSR